MANFVYTYGGLLIADHSLAAALSFKDNVIQIMLIKSGYTPNKEHVFVGDSGSLAAYEADCSGYTGGWGGSGRHTLTGKSIVRDTVNHKVKFIASNPAVWSNLGASPTNTIQGAAIIRKGTADDSDAICLAFFDTVNGSPSFPFLTNGSDFTIQFDADGVMNFVH